MMCVSQQWCPGIRGRWPPGFGLFPLFLLLSSLALGDINIPKDYKVQNMLQPPIITEQPKSTTAFSLEDISLSCEATGSPTPRFRWLKDERDLGVESLGSGTLKAEGEEPLSSYNGTYRCYATNLLGTAMTHTVKLITESTPSLTKESKVKRNATEGDSVVLHCNPPNSSTPPIIHWMDSKLNHIVRSERITTGLDGNLYFANVLTNDSRDDYTCHAQYILARTILPKAPVSLTVLPSNAVASSRKPRLLSPRPSPGPHSSLLALRGHSLVLECIPQGLPTPSVRWRKRDDELQDLGGRSQNFGRWLRFHSVTQEDDGEYECTASNTHGSTTHSYTVTVEAEPYWVKKPPSLLYTPGETVVLECQAEGIPTPNIIWRINGTRLTDVEADGRLSVRGGVLTLMEVQYSDTGVYQCEASNQHGSILTNTYIYVIELPPQILSSDGVVYRVTEGGSTKLHCYAFGSPRPHVTWESEGLEPLLSDPQMSVLTNGTLELTNANAKHTGTYVCSLRNTNINITAHLEVLNRTEILSGPQSVRVVRGHSSSLDCLFYKDPKLTKHQIVWKKDGHKIMESSQFTVFENGTLRVADVRSQDGGQYSCEVITELDNVQTSGSITVVAPPDPPTALSLSEQQDRSLTLRWTPGHTHNSPTTEFLVELREEQHYAEPLWRWEAASRVSGEVNHLKLDLLPYSTYRFRVIGINGLGPSEASQPSDIYSTPPAVPDSNPTGVHSKSNDPGTLVIVWDEMDPRSHNGRGFQYKVSWRQVEGGGPHWSHAHVEAPPLRVNASGAFTPFEIKVRAVNSLGEARPRPNITTGHTGENYPLDSPSGVQVLVLNSTIKVKWDSMKKEQVRGQLLGYRIYLSWLGPRGGRQRRALEKKEQERERQREGGGEEQGIEEKRVVEVHGAKLEQEVSGLRLYSHYELSITVFNSKGEGPHSPTHPFSTPEGVPGPPAALWFESPADSRLTLHWLPPSQPHGLLTGYLLEYHAIVESQDSPVRMETIPDPTVTYFLVDHLDPHSRYLFSLFAHTSAGRGLPISEEGATLLDGVPPSNISMVAGETFVNLSWVPGDRHRNHGFHLRYLRKSAGGEWEESEQVNSTQAFYSLTGLQPGTQYHLRITYGNITHWWQDEVQTKGPVLWEVSGGFVTQGWFIGLISAVVLLMLLLLILCFIKRSKGGKYAVKDKEEGQVDSEARLKDETFGEYRSLESDGDEKRSVSQPSLCVESKLGSEDSLAEYGDSVDIQFNEDGSFIGQYSGRGPVPHDNESSGPASPDNPAPPPPLAPSLSAILNPPS